MQLPKVGDVIERIDAFRDNDRFFLIIERRSERYYKIYNIATGHKSGWNLGWGEDTEKYWEHQWRIV